VTGRAPQADLIVAKEATAILNGRSRSQ